MIKPILKFHNHVIAPIAGKPPEGSKTVSFLDLVRAASIAIACFMAFPPMADGIVVLMTGDGSMGSIIIFIGCCVWLLCLALPYPVARFWLKRPDPVLCDIIALGSLFSALLWDIGSPSLIPLALNSMFVAAFAGWCGTGRGHITVAIAAMIVMYQCYNKILWHGDIKDRGDFYRDVASLCFALSNESSPASMREPTLNVSSCSGPLPEFKSRFPQHLFVKQYYFPAPVVDVMDASSFAFIIVLMYVAMRIQSAELVRQNDAANGAVRTVASIAEALRRYDTATATKTLCAARAPGRSAAGAPSVPLPNERQYDNNDSPKHSVRTGGSILERVTEHSTTVSSPNSVAMLDDELADALAALVVNLEAYRPYVPNWLLRSDTDNAGSGTDGDPCAVLDGKLETEPSKETVVLEYGTVSTQRSPGKSIESSPSMQSLESGYSGTRDTATPGNHQTDHRSSDLRQPTAAVKSVNGVPRRSLCSFALVTYDQTDPNDAASLAALVDAVHRVAMDTKGAVHSFALGEALVSWNCAMLCANPETKAGLFASNLKSLFHGVVPVALHGLRCSVSIATGLARCETTGSVQRVVTAVAPVLHARLRGLAAFARENVASCGDFTAICDAATHAGASQHVVTAPAGVIDVAAHDPPKAVSSSDLIDPHLARRRRLMLPPPLVPPDGELLSLANAPTAVAAFEVVQPSTNDHADEWLYAMTDCASDAAAQATIAAADLIASQTAVLKLNSPRSDSLSVLADVPARAPVAVSPVSCVTCDQQRLLLSAMSVSSFTTQLRVILQRLDKANASSNGAELSKRPLWRAWRETVAAACGTDDTSGEKNST